MKKLVFLLFLIVSNHGFGQSFFEFSEIFYRDGTSEKGYMKMNYSAIKFKKKITDKKSSILTYKEVEKIRINEDGADIEYQYKIIKGRKK